MMRRQQKTRIGEMPPDIGIDQKRTRQIQSGRSDQGQHRKQSHVHQMPGVDADPRRAIAYDAFFRCSRRLGGIDVHIHTVSASLREFFKTRIGIGGSNYR
jgi:hypothetical protein